MKAHLSTFGDFRCAHCHVIVPCAHLVSAVNNRNHCPYCLWSCHLDLYTAGDRLSACKAPMTPIGLTMKQSRNKYQRERRGELMLIHQCTECRTLSINRIAADDGLIYYQDWATDTMIDTLPSSLQELIGNRITPEDFVSTVQDDWATFQSNR